MLRRDMRAGVEFEMERTPNRAPFAATNRLPSPRLEAKGNQKITSATMGGTVISALPWVVYRSVRVVHRACTTCVRRFQLNL